MTKEELLRQVQKEACGCDPMNGWICNFCNSLLPELRYALQVSYRKRKSAYAPEKIPGTSDMNTPYAPVKTKGIK